VCVCVCVCMCVRARVSHFKFSTIQAMFTKFSVDVTEIGNDSKVEARTCKVQKLQAIQGPCRRSVIQSSKKCTKLVAAIFLGCKIAKQWQRITHKTAVT